MTESGVEALVGQVADARIVSLTRPLVAVSVSEYEGTAPAAELPPNVAVGDLLPVYVEGIGGKGELLTSPMMADAENTRRRIVRAYENKEKIDVTVVAVKDNGLVCDVFSTCGIMPGREVPGKDLAEYVGKVLKAVIVRFADDGTAVVSHNAAIEEDIQRERADVLSALSVGKVYEATVTKIMPYGVFADIGAGVEGLIHRTNLSWKNEEPGECCAVGDKIRVSVLSAAEGRIGLSAKEFGEDPWKAFVASAPLGKAFDVEVLRTPKFGAFVQIVPGVEGLIHISELAPRRVKQVEDVVHAGDRVTATVISLDNAKRRVGLSLTALPFTPGE